MSSSQQTALPVHRPHLPFLVFICVTSALGGLLWGFDAIVISGTINPVKTQFALSPTLEGFFVSSGLLGAVIGSGLAGWLSDRFGRSRNLVLAALLLCLSAWGSAFAGNIWLLIMARWLGGLGVGISAMVCPLYISEISPTHLRGRLVTVFQFAITIGIMVALFNNFGLHQWAESISGTVEEGGFTERFVVDETWRVMFASELIPGAVFLLLAFLLPESPRWLVKAGRHDKARQVLQRIFRNGANEEFETIRETLAQERAHERRFIDVLQPRYRKPLIVAMLLAAFAQLSGINVVFYYGTSMLETAGLKSDGALSGMAVIGFCNMIFTTIAMVFVDKVGRRKLLQIGTVGAIACLVGIGGSFLGMERTMRYDLRMASVNDASELAETGESQVILALAQDKLHVRLFNESGTRIVDMSEDMLWGEQAIGELKALLKGESTPDASKWLAEERLKVVIQAATVSGARLNADQTNNYELSLVSEDNVSALAETGRSLAIVAQIGDSLHVRIFDENGERVADKPESLLSREQVVDELRALFKADPSSDLAKWKEGERQKVILQAAVVSGKRHVVLVLLMCAFVAFFAFSLGPIKFIFASEIFPTNIRSHAMSIVILTMWATDTLVAQFTPDLREAIGPSGTFFLFACFLVPQIFVVWKLMPETAGRSLEEIERTFYDQEKH